MIAWTPARRVQIIIAKHKEYIGLLRTRYPHLNQIHKLANARGARGQNHCQTKGIHRFTAEMLPKHSEKQYMRERSRGSRESLPNIENTIVYRWDVTQTKGKFINEWTLAGRVARIIAKHGKYIGVLQKCYPNIRNNKQCVNACGARADNQIKNNEYIG